MQHTPKVSVIISTYNQPQWLDLVLYGYQLQTENDFEIIIADDGSSDQTQSVIASFCSSSSIQITHVWHEDKGFRKTVILNKAITKASAPYLLFTDGDCIPRQDFVATHLALQRPNSALSGGYFKLGASISNSINKSVIKHQECFDALWLIANGQPKTFKLNKLSATSFKAKWLNRLTPTKATFDGMNVSCWKADIIAVNGFDERMAYGGEDREVGERMMNNGIAFIQVRYSAICVHLYHERPYKNESALHYNTTLRKTVKRQRLKWTDFGIEQ